MTKLQFNWRVSVQTFVFVLVSFLSVKVLAQQEEVVSFPKNDDKEEWYKYLNNYSEMATGYIQMGKIDKAQQLLYQVNNLPPHLLKKHPSLQLEIWHMEGNFALYKGDISTALEWLTKIEPSSQTFLSLSPEKKVEYLKTISLAWAQSGNLEQADLLARQAILIAQNQIGKSSEEAADAYNNIGLILTSKRPEQARAYYQQSLSIYQKIEQEQPSETIDEKIAYTKVNLGVIARNQEKYVVSESYLKDAISIFEKDKNQLAKAFVLNNLSQTAFLQGYFDDARNQAKESLKIYEQNYGKRHPEVAVVYNQLGTIEEGRENFDEAISFYQSALMANTASFDNVDKKANPPSQDYLNADILLLSLTLKARVLERKHYEKSLRASDLKKALEALKVADEIINKVRLLRTSEEDKIALGERASQVCEMGIRIAYRLSEFPINKNTYKELAFYFAERNKAAVLLAAIADTKAKKFAGIPDSLLNKEKNLQTQITYAERLLYETQDETAKGNIRNELISLRQRKTTFNQYLEENYPNYYDLKYDNRVASLSQVQKKLDTQTMLVSYSSLPDHIYIFKVTKDKLDIFQLEEDKLEEKIVLIRNSIDFQSYDDFVNSSSSLTAQLLDIDLSKNINKMVFIPEGNIGKVPFEALFSRKISDAESSVENYQTLPYLIKDYQISYAYSSTLFLEQKERKGKEGIFLFAPVEFTELGLQDLAGTRQEVESIYEMFRKKQITTSLHTFKQAQKDLFFKVSLADYRFIHLATHGKVNEDNPDLSRIFVTSSDGQTTSLFTSDIYNIQTEADLVLMSACQTGLGKSSKGEGIIGLSRAWLYAGAENLIVSLWQVDDLATKMLTTSFYEYALETPLSEQADYAEALQKAKLKLIKQEGYADPFFWSAFILIGR